jgi:hypothetical protein
MEDEVVGSGEIQVAERSTGFPTNEELASEGFEIDNESIDEAPQVEKEQIEHRGVKTEQQMLDELANEEAGESTDQPKEGFKIPDDFKDVLKRGDELKSVGYQEMKELAQKGWDYTKKTQEHAEVVKEFETVAQQKEQEISNALESFKKQTQEHEQILDEYNRMEYAFEIMKEKDPDLLEQITEYAKIATRELNNPVNRHLKTQISKLEQRLQEVSQSATQRETVEKNQYIAKSFNDDLSKVKTSYDNTFKKIGITPDWEKVKGAWIAGEKQNTTVEQAVFQVYGPDIAKLYESKLKVAAVENKAGKKPMVSSRTNLPKTNTSKSKSWKQFGNDIFSQLSKGDLEF